MNNAIRLSVLLLVFGTIPFYAQDMLQIHELDELIIEQNKLSKRLKSQRIFSFNDSILNHTIGTFTDFLQKNTTIYFKENGAGMVSSPSFRGTTAQQTSVLWNGIKVNSNLLGQSDFNSTSFKNYDAISIKAGGGSVLYGSGAIGGTVHLNNELFYNKTLQQTLQLGYGSFATKTAHYKISGGKDKLALNAHLGYNQSENDYKWQIQNRKNSNGEYYNLNFGTEIGYKINTANTLEYFGTIYSDERHFSLITPYQTKTKYQNQNFRNLVKWHYSKKNWLNTLYLSSIQENYTYFDQLPTASKSGGKSNMFLLKNETFYQASKQLKLGSLIEYQTTIALGNNTQLPKSNQQIGSYALQAYYDFDQQGFELGLKNEFAKDYANPFLFSLGYYFNTKNYQLKINGSKNYRIPTFNDLYWQPGGNLNLKPETSYQFDVNQNLNFNHFTFNVSAYFIEIENMLRWLPTNTGLWAAANTNNVTIKGSEVYFNYQNNWQNHVLAITTNFAYTQAVNKGSKNQLTYTPKHKVNSSINYRYKTLSITPSLNYIDKIQTTESNSTDSTIKAYTLFDIAVTNDFFKSRFPFTLSFQIKNITNKKYYTMPEREMPGTNYHITLIKKF